MSVAQATAPRKTKRAPSLALRAYQQADQYIVAPNSCEGNDWQVIKRDGSYYIVDLDAPRCSCPFFRGPRRPGNCKHLELVRLHVQADAPAPVVFESLSPREWSLQSADECCSPEDYDDRPTLDEELKHGHQDEERSNRRPFSSAERAKLMALWD